MKISYRKNTQSMLAIFVLFSFCVSQNLVSIKKINQVVKYEYKKQEHIESIFVIDKKLESRLTDEYLFIIRAKSGFNRQAIFEGYWNSKKIKCKSAGDFICIFPYKNYRKKLMSKKGFIIQWKLECEDKKKDCEFSYQVFLNEYLEMEQNQMPDTIFTSGLESLSSEVIYHPNKESDKIRFLGRANFDSNKSSFDIFINKDTSKWPTRTAHDFKLDHLHKDRLAIVKQEGDKDFCEDTKEKSSYCTYRIVFLSNKVNNIGFEISRSLNIELISSGNEYFDETDNNKKIFKFIIEDNLEKNDIVIKFTPIKGKPRLYVNPESLPVSLDKAVWRSDSSSSGAVQHIAITKQERNNSVSNMKTGYIIVTSEEPSSFYITLGIRSDDPIDLQEGFSYLDYIEGKKIVNYVSILKTIEIKQTFQLEFSLTSHRTNPILGLKSCKVWGDCKFDEPFTHQDEDNFYKESRDPSSNDFIRINDKVQLHKTISLSFECDKSNAVSESEIDNDLKEKYCLVAVAVYGNDSQEVQYNLSYHDQGTALLVTSLHEYPLRLIENSRRLLQYNFKPDDEKQYLSIDFRVDVNYGAVEVKIKKDDESICEINPEDVYLKTTLDHSVKNALGQKEHLYFNRYSGTSIKNNFEGTYYICIIPKRTSYLNFSIYPVRDTETFSEKGNKKPNVTEGLGPGQILSGEMTEKGETLYFSFPVNLNDQTDYIAISLTPIKGVFSVFARAQELPSANQEFWTSDDNFLLIKKSDTEFVNGKNFIVGVKLLSETNTKKWSAEIFQFSVQYSFKKHHNTLKSGIYLSGKFPEKRVYFSLEISKEMDSIMILKSQGSMPFDMYLSFDLDNIFPTQENNDYFVQDIQSGIDLSKVDLDKLKKQQKGHNYQIYITLYGIVNTDYGLTWNYNNQPFIINESKPLFPPMLIDENTPLKFLTYVNANKPFQDIQASNSHQVWEIYVDMGNGYFIGNNFPEKNLFRYKALGSQTIHIDIRENIKEADINNLQFLIAIYPHKNNNKNLMKYYNFENYGKIEAFSDLRELEVWTPHTASISQDEWQYFRISNNINNENILISIEPQDESNLDIYVTKGQNTRPTKTVFIKKANALRGNEQEITKNDITLIDKDLKGDYIIGIYGITDATYSLIWQHSKSRMIRAIFGKPFSIRLQPRRNQYMIFDSGSVKNEINIKFGSRDSNVHVYVITLTNYLAKSHKMPSPKNYFWYSSLDINGGTNKLKISSNDNNYCLKCKYLVLLKSDKPARVDLALTISDKNDIINFFQIIENKYVVDYLKKDEKQKYYFDISSEVEKFTIDFQIIFGKVTFYYGKTAFLNDQTAIYKYPFHSYQEFFTMSLGEINKFKQNQLNVNERRYFMIVAESDTSYRLIVRRDNMISKQDPQKLRYSSLANNDNHYYLHHVDKEKSIEIEFELKNILNIKYYDLKNFLEKLEQSIEVYWTNSVETVKQKRFDYPLQKQNESKVYNKIYFSVPVRKGVCVIKITNIFGQPIFYSILLNIDNKKEMKILNPTLAYVDQFSPKFYSFHAKNNGFLNIDSHKCFGDISTYYALQKPEEKVSKIHWKTLFNQNLSLAKVQISGDTMVYLKFMKAEAIQGLNNDISPEKPSELNNKIPSVFSFTSYVSTNFNENSFDEIINLNEMYEFGPLLRVIAGDDQIYVRFQPLHFKNLNNLKKGNHIQITYTLYLATNQDLLQYVSYCQNYMKVLLDENQIIENNEKSFRFQLTKRFDIEKNEITMDYNNMLSIVPNNLENGIFYYGKLVASVETSNITNNDFFPSHKTYSINYGSLSFQTPRFPISKDWLISLCFIQFLILFCYICTSCKIIKQILKFKFTQLLIKEFDENVQGNAIEVNILQNIRNTRVNQDSEVTQDSEVSQVDVVASQQEDHAVKFEKDTNYLNSLD